MKAPWRARAFLVLSLFAPVLASASVLRIKVDAPIHPVTVRIRRPGPRAGRPRGRRPRRPDPRHARRARYLDARDHRRRSSTPGRPSPLSSARAGPGPPRPASSSAWPAISSPWPRARAPGAAHPVGVSLTGSAMDKTMEEKVVERRRVLHPDARREAGPQRSHGRGRRPQEPLLHREGGARWRPHRPRRAAPRRSSSPASTAGRSSGSTAPSRSWPLPASPWSICR